MTFQTAGPGKTSPKLYQDFLVFDPVRGKPNVLADITPHHGDGPQLAPPIGSCRHDYITKASQSVLPPLDLRPDGNTTYKAAVVCKKCRIHADIWLDHSNAKTPCPTSDYPLHHFQRKESHDKVTTERIRYAWQCSSVECRASLFILFRKPRISDGEKDLLTNPELLKRRYNALVQNDPNREGMKEATQMDSLARLRRYIKDSLDPKRDRRSFPANNKRFQEAFGINGQDCRELLDRLGFKYAVSSTQDDQDQDWDLCGRQDVNWNLPHPEQIGDRLTADGKSLRELLEDVEIELLIWMQKFSAELGLINPVSGEHITQADRDIERTLAAQGYPRYVALRRAAGSNADLPFLNSLGALPDFSDSLVEFAHDRQALCDPAAQAYYLECLQVITEDRQTEQLQMKLATLQSQDVVSRRDLRAAYRFLNIQLRDASDVSDARVVELFQAQQPDLGVAAQEEARSHLYKIGVSRNSTLIINASRQSVETYEDALSWLGNGVDKNTPDEGILAVLAIKTGDSQANEEIGQKAISAIAKARKSNMLNNWLLTGRQDGYTMSADEALRHLAIDQKLEALDPTILPALFESARQDRPGETTEKAITAIQEAMSGTAGGATKHSPETWPVGLTSHGNTCYLNSLLQYYFSIQPLRDIVLNYDKYKLDTTTHGEKTERVGHRMITMVEIEGGQRFAEDLKYLFERMINSRASSVKPEADLVCRAFLKPKEYKLLGPILKDEVRDNSDAVAVNGVNSAIDDKLTDGETILSPTEITGDERNLSNASSTTLQASVNGDDRDVSMKDAEMPPTPPVSPGLKGQEQQPQPEHAPPLPPRRFSTTKEEALAKAEANARQQQDVTEVHDQITFLLRCGMLPRGRDTMGEQEDALNDLFSMRMTQTTVKKGVEQKPQLLPDSAIQLNVPYEPIDLYSALDGVFDLQPYAENPAIEIYKSIESLPPLLQISIPRIGYDVNRTGGAVYKSTECVRLEDELYLDRYSDASHENTLPKRRQCWGWRRQLQSLKRERKLLSETLLNLNCPAVVAQTANYLTSLDEVNRDLQEIDVEPIEADGDITAALKAESEQQSRRLDALDSEIDNLQTHLSTQFEEMKNIKYRLAAVFFHRGSYGHGHYWIYIRDFANSMWRLYNDENVEEFVKMDSIFEAKAWDQGTPTYAVYVAEDKMEYVQPVCRDPEEEPQPKENAGQWTATDTEMANSSSKQDPGTAIDPALMNEGGQKSWDQERQVADGVKW